MTDNLPAEKKWTSEQMALIQNTMAPNCDQNEFALMMYQAKTYRVDPLTTMTTMVYINFAYVGLTSKGAPYHV